MFKICGLGGADEAKEEPKKAEQATSNKKVAKAAVPEKMMSPEATVTTENIFNRLNDSNALTNMGARLERYDCASLDDKRTSCNGNIRIGDFGISFLAKSAPSSKDVTYAAVMMANPGVAGGGQRSLVGAFLVVEAHLMATFNPEIARDRRHRRRSPTFLQWPANRTGTWCHPAS
jgi:hypothetical protein